MPIPAQRDAATTRSALSRWFAPALGADGAVDVGEPRGPGATGFSNETLLVDLRWSSGGSAREATYVVRVAPSGYALFPDASFSLQYDVLRVLGERTPVPVPAVRWFEPDPAYLGAPFFVMDEVRGRVPPDNPPYHVDGWLTSVTAEHRERVWWGGVDTIAEVHALDWRALGLDALEHPEIGVAPGAGQQLAYYERFLASVEEHEPVPMARRALEWLRRHQPQDEELVLSWGDARIGNIMYGDAGERLAVLDWEMACVGAPAQDLAWALFLDRHHSEGCGVPRLEGFPDARATVARYEERAGREVRDLGYYEVLAAFRFCVIMARLARLFKEWELLAPDDAMAQDSTVTRLTETVLAERGG